MDRIPVRRTGGSREVASRFLGPADSPPSASGSRSSSPLRRKPSLDRKQDARNGGGLWPSTAKKSGTLADHLGNDRLMDLAEGRGKETSETAPNPRRSKENRPISYIEKLRFPRSNNPIAPGRASVDEIALRRRSDIGVESPSAESDPKIRLPRSLLHHHHLQESRSSDSLPVQSEAMMKRSNSYRSGKTQWAMSPGRPPVGSPPGGGRSFSTLRPASPGKGRGVGNFISMGLDLFKRKPSGNGSSSPSSSPSVAASSPPRGVAVLGETGHQFRMVHSRLIQWRYLNARSEAVNQIKMVHAEGSLLSAWMGVSKLQASVVQKRIQLQKEKLGLKLTTILSSQMKELEGWGDMERQHANALSTTKGCLQSVLCRVPLVDGAKADPQLVSIKIRRATDLAMTIKNTLTMFDPMSESVVPLLSELAHVVNTEKSLLEECFELQGLVATLQIQEQSLKCQLIQLNSVQQQQIEAAC